jgi:hypothetical protein
MVTGSIKVDNCRLALLSLTFHWPKQGSGSLTLFTGLIQVRVFHFYKQQSVAVDGEGQS